MMLADLEIVVAHNLAWSIELVSGISKSAIHMVTEHVMMF